MKQLLFLAAICLPIMAFSQSDTRLAGNWREVSRKGSGNQGIDFQDTLRMEFLTGNEYVWHKGGSFNYRGSYKINNSDLDLGMARFTIAERSNNRIVLKAEDGTVYELEPYTAPSNTPAAKRQETPGPVNTIGQMTGNWTVYKRTSDRILEKVDYTRQIKRAEILSSPKDGKWGYFFASMDAADSPSWFVESYAKQIITLSGKGKRWFKVIKAQDNELILEENGITYFFKQFNK
jgi:hypothetical protein